jgi:hypothetical protein
VLHWGQYSSRRGLIAWCARRLPLRALELLRFGTAMEDHPGGAGRIESKPSRDNLLRFGKRIIVCRGRRECQAAIGAG